MTMSFNDATDGPNDHYEFNLAEVQEAIGDGLGTREAIVSSERRLTWNELTDRTRRLANFFLTEGLTVRRERRDLGGSEVGQDRVAVLLHSRAEYIETMLGSFKARLAPCNVNYRYVASELASLFDDMNPAAIIYEGAFADELERALTKSTHRPLLLEVGATQSRVALPRAISYEEALASSSSMRPDGEWSPDDLYILYTGGTTGRPKGVLWRQADVFCTALGGRNYRDHAREWRSLNELRTFVHSRDGVRALSAAPFMHGTGQWIAFQALHTGGAIVIPSVIERFDASDVLDTVSREQVGLLAIAGESFAKPLLEAIAEKDRDLSSLRTLVSSGAALSPKSKGKLLELVPGLRIRDTVGSSEAGPIAQVVSGGTDSSNRVRFDAGDSTFVISDKFDRRLEPGHDGAGWLARGGRLPLGYFNDPRKTQQTFRVVDGVRVSIPGDRARIEADGSIEVLGRDSVTINSGGEKIFAEEIEAVIMQHADVHDVIVVGRPSDRWGSEVVALIEAKANRNVEPAVVIALCREQLARYKTPKQVVLVDHVQRTAAGKPDYVWAQRVAVASQ
jgi:acyl-CoA synthetase (AMP-forming)/AMP-acid ligase II